MKLLEAKSEAASSPALKSTPSLTLNSLIEKPLLVPLSLGVLDDLAEAFLSQAGRQGLRFI